jgi:hypothetical protein
MDDLRNVASHQKIMHPEIRNSILSLSALLPRPKEALLRNYYEITVADMNVSRTLIDLMANHAHLSTRGMRDRWMLRWCGDAVMVWFERIADWRHFCQTFAVDHAAYLRQHNLLNAIRFADR